MKHVLNTGLAALLLLSFGCANPASDAPEAVVEEPAPVAEPVTEVMASTWPLGGSVGFVGSKVTGTHEGGFEDFDGEVVMTSDSPEGATVNVTIDTNSLWSDDERLTGHLKSADFFDVETYPTATFNSTAIAANDDGTYTLTGNLDLHGVTKQISFPANISLSDSGFTADAEFSIKRFDFGIEYPGKADDLIRDEVLIKLDLTSDVADAGEEATEEETTEGEEATS